MNGDAEETIWEETGGGGAVRVVRVPGLDAYRFEIEDENRGPGPECGKFCPGDGGPFDFTVGAEEARALALRLLRGIGNEPPSSNFEDVRAFQVALGLVARDRPQLLPGEWKNAEGTVAWLDIARSKTRALAVAAGNEDAFARRMRLIVEELTEMAEAHAVGNLAEFADALADLAWVVLGTAVEAGIPFDEVWAEVRRANMAKLGGKLDASGKLQKPPGWSPPDIASVIARASSRVDAETEVRSWP